VRRWWGSCARLARPLRRCALAGAVVLFCPKPPLLSRTYVPLHRRSSFLAPQGRSRRGRTSRGRLRGLGGWSPGDPRGKLAGNARSDCPCRRFVRWLDSRYACRARGWPGDHAFWRAADPAAPARHICRRTATAVVFPHRSGGSGNASSGPPGPRSPDPSTTTRCGRPATSGMPLPASGTSRLPRWLIIARLIPEVLRVPVSGLIESAKLLPQGPRFARSNGDTGYFRVDAAR
jgi:hypothetical protein